MRRDSLLDLSVGFARDRLGWELGRLDLPERRRRVLEGFSGVLGVDEPGTWTRGSARTSRRCSGTCRS